MNVSVIIPVYNAVKYIEKAIQSCLAIPQIKEIIVVDDGYPDQAFEIVQKMAANEPKIKWFTHENNANKGAGASRNLGIQKASQQWLAFLDADDFFLPHRFEKDEQILKERPDADGFYNAIGAHFYSEIAKDNYQSLNLSEITTVNPKWLDENLNLFQALLGMPKGFGYFSLDGFTVKREKILDHQIWFPETSMHEDTQWLIQNAYYNKLLPSEIEESVAMRGVHNQNRITKNAQSKIALQAQNRAKMWKSLKEWANNNDLSQKERNFINTQVQFFELLSSETPKYHKFLKTLFKNPRLLKHPKYHDLHKAYLGQLSYSHHLYRIRNFVIQFL